jgi:signal peptidase I
MFGLFSSPDKKMRENAANWLELAEKVWNFRRDQLNTTEAAELMKRTEEVRQQVKEKVPAEKLKLTLEALEDVLRRTGGAIYPKSSLVENVEFFLVAAIVILGIRTYFVQPFKIPTNSMWPTYNGMTPEVFTKAADEPAAPIEAVRMLALGAWPHRVDSTAEGEVLIPVSGTRDRVYIPYQSVQGRSWLVFPTTLKEYTLYVGEQPVRVQVPADFDFEWAVRDAFFPDATPSRQPSGVDLARAAAGKNALIRDRVNQVYLRTGKTVKRGDRVMAFDILTGDQLFVDRFSYHFIEPSVGSGFVFRTGNIPDLVVNYGDQYFVKRLVGVPGDVLEVKAHGLLRNNAPITGAEAFAANANQTGNYPGYEAREKLAPGLKVEVPARSFFAMGDNSPNSQDGRYWGFVPAKDVVGRPLFVYFPFTRHWGPAR